MFGWPADGGGLVAVVDVEVELEPGGRTLELFMPVLHRPMGPINRPAATICSKVSLPLVSHIDARGFGAG